MFYGPWETDVKRKHHGLVVLSALLVMSCSPSGRPIIDPYGAARVGFARAALSRISAKTVCLSVDFRELSEGQSPPKEQLWIRVDPPDGWFDLLKHEGLMPASRCSHNTEQSESAQLQIGPLLVIRRGRAVAARISYGLPARPTMEECVAELNSEGEWRTSCSATSEA